MPGSSVQTSGLAVALESALARVTELETEVERLTAQLRNLADHDPLTDLLKPATFEHELDAHVVLGSRYGPKGALLVVDLDRFAGIGQEHGAAVADEILVLMAERFRTRLPETDVVGRLGPDRFAMLLPFADRTEATAVGSALAAAVREPVDLPASPVGPITASVGVSLVRHDDTAAVLLRRATQAMLDAKQAGGDQVAEGLGPAGPDP